MSNFCPNCGNELKKNEKICEKCGKLIPDNTLSEIMAPKEFVDYLKDLFFKIKEYSTRLPDILNSCKQVAKRYYAHIKNYIKNSNIDYKQFITKKVICIVGGVLALVIITCVGIGMNANSVSHIVKTSFSDSKYMNADDNISIVSQRSFSSQINGLPSPDANIFVLIKFNSETFSMGLVNKKDKSFIPVYPSYEPLYILFSYTLPEAGETQFAKAFNALVNYYEKNGFTYFDSIEQGEEFLEHIGKTAILSNDHIRQELKDHVSYILTGLLDENDEATIYFDGDSVVPKNYVIAEYKLSYRWTRYNVLEEEFMNMSSEKIRILDSELGPPYEFDWSYSVYDNKLNKLKDDTVFTVFNKVKHEFSEYGGE